MNNVKPTRRSDKVRRRLEHESKTWIDQASRRLIDPSSSSNPINSNGESLNPSINPHAKKHNNLFRVGWRLVSLVLVGFFSFAIFTAWRSPQYKVSEISISGLQRITEEEVLTDLDIIGQHTFALNTQAIKQNLQRKYPELWDIEIFLSIPAHVSIRLIERQPMIAWNFNDIHMWIDAEGYLIPARNEEPQMLTIKANALPPYQLALEKSTNKDDDEEPIINIIRDKPSIKGKYEESIFFMFKKQISPNMLTAILQLNAWMPEESELLYEAVRGIGWNDTRGWNVFIGSKLENINDKMLMYEMIVRKLDEQGIKPTVVSVEFLHAPYYRLEN